MSARTIVRLTRSLGLPDAFLAVEDGVEIGRAEKVYETTRFSSGRWTVTLASGTTTEVESRTEAFDLLLSGGEDEFGEVYE